MPAELVDNCPRCSASNVTFDALADAYVGTPRIEWMSRYEVFCVCRRCKRATTFVLELARYEMREVLRTSSPSSVGTGTGTLDRFMDVLGYINLSDVASVKPPEHLPDQIKAAFEEGAKCLAVQCFNASATMFRMCVDLATRPLLPPEGAPGGPNSKQRRDLGLRLPWLFENGRLDSALHELASCIKEDGNDGAHAGTLKREDAEDVLDFTTALLTRLYTEPKQLEMARARRDERRAPK